MKLRLIGVLAAAVVGFAHAGSAQAKRKIVVSYPYVASLVREIARERSEVAVLAKGDEDPHFVVPRPSFIGKLRQADLLIINGASLEIGFIPPLIRQASNPRILPSAPGFLDLSASVALIDKPRSLSRSEGDVHPEGNPHFILDWHNVPALARAIAEALGRIDRAGAAGYQQNLEAFLSRWRPRSAAWDRRAAPLRGQKLLQYHRLFNYFAGRTGMIIVGELEPKPGIPPTSRHLAELIEANGSGTVHLIAADAYHEQSSPAGLAKKLSARWAVLPHDLGAVPGVQDLFGLYDTLLARALP
ncbi:MAG: zinc ABC transporter substrate-binding protein [Proteobacteria bacterium]|nr:zinc ABC transporter substrate-binding protein [Pseudomonadota bacterium]